MTHPRNRTRPIIAAAALAALLFAGPLGRSANAAAGPVVSQPHVKVCLIADRVAVEPGGQITIGIRFELDSEWHIYWRHHGGTSGLPTEITLALPPGWSASPLRFPAPTSHHDDLGEITYILEGTPIILADLTAPAAARPGEKATISASASWLVCKKECIKGEADLRIEIPIASPGDKIEPANERDFRRARHALPVAAADAKYVKLRPDPVRPAVKPGDKFSARIVLEVEKGFHLQSAKPLSKGLIATEVFLAPPDGFLVDPPQYPPGHEREDKVLGKLSEYNGAITIDLPIEITDELAAGPVTLYGVLRYQACNDAGTCFPPISVAFDIPYNGAAAAVPATTAEPADGEPNPAIAAARTTAAPAPPATAGTWLDTLQNGFARFGIFGFLAMAFIGGFVLNLMPCVLPVISIKVLSFVQQAHESRGRVFALGLAFAAGIEASFLILAALIISGSRQWGGLFQSPHFVIALAAIVTAFALSLFGVFALNPPRVINALGEKAHGEGLANAFATGLLATVLGTACTAPFLSAVIAFAVKQTPVVGAGIFGIAGFGMALPYVVLAANPAWVRLVPRPGPWMTTFERVVGFLLLATAVWLLNPLGAQLGADGLLWTLVFLLFVAAAAWLYGRLEFGAPVARRLRAWAGVVVLVAGGWWFCFRLVAPIDQLIAAQRELRLGGTATVDVAWSDAPEIPWVPYTRQRADDAVRAGRTVFVDYTAEWCVNCKANEKLVLNTAPVRDAMRKLGVVPFKADFTSEDEEIKADLQRYGRSGVPMYLVIPAGKPDRAVVLPEILTVATVVDALNAAGPSVGAAALPPSAPPPIIQRDAEAAVVSSDAPAEPRTR